MNKHSLLLIPVFAFFLFNSCKKGADDPFISLQSRKARVQNSWTLEKGKISWKVLDIEKAENYDGVYTLNGTKVHGTESTPTTISEVSFTYMLNLTFEKDGSFKMKETAGKNFLEAEGTWNFSGGVGEDKNKESIQINLDRVIKGRTSAHFFNQQSGSFRYRIKELRSKRMVITSSALVYGEKGGDEVTISAEYELKPI